MSPDVSNLSNTSVSIDFSGNSTLPSVALVSSKVPPTETSVQAASDDMNLYLSVRDSVKVTRLIHSMESSMPNIFPIELVS